MSASINPPPHAGVPADDPVRALDLAIASDEPAAIIAAALQAASRPAISTNFRPGAAALLHMVVAQKPDIPVIWVDTGYNTADTYAYVENLQRAWDLNLEVYTPRLTAARHTAIAGAVPARDHAAFPTFVRHTKLEPFERAFAELKPDVWFTGIRRDQTEYRRSLDVVSRGHRGSIRVAPLYAWTSDDVEQYLAQHGIADNAHYVDPTKPAEHLECGLQQLA